MPDIEQPDSTRSPPALSVLPTTSAKHDAKNDKTSATNDSKEGEEVLTVQESNITVNEKDICDLPCSKNRNESHQQTSVAVVFDDEFGTNTANTTKKHAKTDEIADEGIEVVEEVEVINATAVDPQIEVLPPGFTDKMAEIPPRILGDKGMVIAVSLKTHLLRSSSFSLMASFLVVFVPAYLIIDWNLQSSRHGYFFFSSEIFTLIRSSKEYSFFPF